MMRIIFEFKEFLQEYKVIGLAVAFVMGVAATTLIQALVNDLVMPIIGAFIPGGVWQTAVLTIWKFNIAWGHLLSSIINFIIIAWVIFLIAKFILKEEKVTKK